MEYIEFQKDCVPTLYVSIHESKGGHGVLIPLEITNRFPYKYSCGPPPAKQSGPKRALLLLFGIQLLLRGGPYGLL